jgi:chromatin segregation and condensation protein Rec8/ScpA/Scc1 (kleisin family)
MKHVFLKRYQDHCRVSEDIFGMTQGEEESLEDYVEHFQYNLQRSKQRQLGKETLKTLLLKGIQDKFLEILNLMGTCDVFQLPYDDICELCRRYSRGNFKIGKNSRELSSLFLKSVART